MRTHRVYSTHPLHPGARVLLDDNAVRHLVQALRLKSGDPVVLFDGSGCDYAAELVDVSKRSASAKVGDAILDEPPLALQLHLAIGISRGERMDFSIQKAVELGVSQITPLFTERTQVQLKGERLSSRVDHWQGVIRHACEQSGRSRLPELNAPLALPAWLQQFSGSGVMLDHRATQALTELPAPDGALSLLVGPEGGLSAAERELAARQGLQGVRMGPRVLRTETAPLAALAIMQALWGDFRL